MKPIELKIKGLNSFVEEQCIDFSKLTERGIFGIFGVTGSGKSSILDAITMALYGDIARETKEFINQSSNLLSLSYRFEIGSGEGKKTYIADRIVKKDKNNKYKLSSARLREVQGEEEVVIAEGAIEVKNEVEQIMGLTATDFTRSVVLPQGKFSEFLRLSGKEKRDMLERIFGLQKYGELLGRKIREAKKRNIDSLNILLSAISKHEEKGVSVENYERIKTQLQQMIEEEKQLEEERKEHQKLYEHWKEIWELQIELEQCKRQSTFFYEREKEINQKKDSIQLGKKALECSPFLEAVEQTEGKLLESEGLRIKWGEALKIAEKKLKDIEVCYEEIVKKKEKEVPMLIKKETNLLQALEIEKKIKELEKDRAELLQGYQEKTSEFKKISTLLSEAQNENEKIENNLLEMERKIAENRIEPEFREGIQKAFFKEREFELSCKRLEELEGRFRIKERKYKEIEEQYQKTLMDKLMKEEKAKESAADLKELLGKCPGGNIDLLEKQEKLNAFKEKLKEKTKIHEKNEKDKILQKELQTQKEGLEKELQSIKEGLQKKIEELDTLKRDLDELEKSNMASMLVSSMHKGEPCPVCGSKEHPNLALPISPEKIEEKKKAIVQLEKAVFEQQELQRRIEIKKAGVEKEEEYKLAELKEMQKEIEEISIDVLEEEGNEKEKIFLTLKEAIEKWDKEKVEKEKIASEAKEKLYTICEIEAKWREAGKREKSGLEELQAELQAEKKKNSILGEECKSLKEVYGIPNIGEAMEKLKKMEKELTSFQAKEKEWKGNKKLIEEKKDKLTEKIKNVEIEIARILESGKEKKAMIEKERGDRERLAEGKDPESEMILVREKMEFIGEGEQRLKKELETQKEEVQSLSDQRMKEEQTKVTLTKLLSQQKQKLQSLMEKCNFMDRKNLKDSVVAIEYIEQLETEVEKFEDEFKKIKDNIQRIQGKLGEERIEREQWESIKDRSRKIEEEWGEKKKYIGGLNKTILDMEQDLEELKKQNIIRKKLEHKGSMLEDLDKLIQGNKFVEYVAMNQLKYIVLEASKRLKAITRERYALEIDGNGNFVMRDDHNGGAVRAANTLSGGETFLTSLALALALSSQIQLKGSAPLQFFFLDEGFGTLDNELLETVICSLEKLHSDKLAIGIITHVEELKNRVPVKLIVDAPIPGIRGSKVHVEWS